MNEELELEIQKLIDAGKSDDEIKGFITNYVETKKEQAPQKVDAPAEPESTASNSAASFSELPTYTDDPEIVKKAKESGFDVLPGARQEGDTIKGITLPEVQANPLTFKEQLDKEKVELETKVNNFYTEISKASKVLKTFEKQNLREDNVDPPTQSQVNEYNTLVKAYNEKLSTGQKELETLSAEYDKRVDEFNKQGEQQKLTAKQSIKNSFSNLIQDGRNVVDYYFGEGIGLDLATDQVYRSIFGDERVDAFIQRHRNKGLEPDDTFLGLKVGDITEGLLTKEQRIQKIEAFKDKQQDRKPTLGVIESFAEGNIGDQAASVLSAIVNVGGSVIYNSGTVGTGYFMDFAAQNYIDYNTEIAKTKGKTLEQLILDGEDDGDQAIRLASLQAGAEYLGYRKLKKALGGKMPTPKLMPKKVRDKFNYNPKAKTTLNILTTGVSESATEVFQGGIEEYNKKSAIDPDVSFSNTILEYAQSPEGMESGVQGFLGASGLATGSYSARAVAQTRRGVDGLKVEAQINEILSISEQIEKAKDYTVIKGLEEKRDIKTQELQRNIKKGNDIYNQLSEGDITELESIYDIADVQAARAVELQRKFNRKEISEQEYKSALEGYRDSYEAAQARATQILADKTAENVEQQIKELSKAGIKGKLTRLGKSDIANDQTLGDMAEAASNQYGFIKQFGDGEFEIIINTDKQPKLTEIHELGHALLYKTIGNNKEIQDNLGDALIEHVSKIKGDKTALGQRLASYGQFNEQGEFVRDANFGEEVIVLMSESIADGSLRFEENFFTKIGDTIRRFLQRTGLKEVRLDTGRDVFNFVKDYTASISEGKIDKAIIKAATEGAKGKLVEGKEDAKPTTQFSKIYQEVEAMKADLINPSTKQGTAFIAADALSNEVDRRLPRIEGITAEERADIVRNFVLDDNRGLVGLLNNYNPDRNDSVMGYLNSSTPGGKLLDARLQEFYKDDPRFGQIFQTTTDEAVATKVERETAIEEATPTEAGRKTKDIVLADRLNIQNEITTEVNEQDVKFSTLSNFKSVPNAARNTIGKLLGISPDKIKSKANLTAAEVASAQRWFNTNAALVIQALPQGFDSSGKATGVPRTILEALYNKRESRAKTKAGLQTQVKRTNIKDSELLELVDIIDGKPTRNRNTSARVIALADLLGKVITNQEIRRQNPELTSISDGMANYMFSKEDTDLNKMLRQENKAWKSVVNAAAQNVQPIDIVNNNADLQSYRDFVKNTIAPNFPIEMLTVGTFAGAGANGRKRNFAFTSKEDLLNYVEGVNFAPSDADITAAVSSVGKYGKLTGKTVAEKLKNSQYHESSRRGAKKIWLKIQEIMQAQPETIPYFATMFASTSQNMGHFARVSSTLEFTNTLNEKNVEEHTLPASDFAKFLFNRALQGNLELYIDGAFENYAQGSLPLSYDKKLKGEINGVKFNFVQAPPLEYHLDILLGLKSKWIRYFNPLVNANDGGINPNYLVNARGETIAEEFGLGVDASLHGDASTISTQQNLLYQFLNGDITASQAKNNLDSFLQTRNKIKPNAEIKQNSSISQNISNVRPVLAYSKDSKGMSTFDFDETLIIDGENFVTATKDGETVRIPSDKWPIDGPRYAEQGYSFDFSDFVNVRGGKEGPLLQKMKNQIRKYGPSNVFVLTARMQEAAEPIHQWLKSQGINIPIKNITGLGKSEGDAKAAWFLEKYQEGYNDMYFVDDALPNVEAVKHVFDQLDVKGKSVQARVQFSKDLNSEFNKMIERTKGVAAEKTFSRVVGQKRGKNIGRYRFFVPPSAEDFAGLLYDFYGKGEQGNADMEFMKKALLDPFGRADREMSEARMSILEDYKLLRKEIPNVKKRLGKLIEEDTGFTFDNAVRVYLFDKAGFEVPGISKRDLNYLKNVVNTDQDLKTFADALSIVSKRDKGWIEPGENWSVESIASDLENIVNKIGRKQYLSEFIENKNIIFSPENMNKIEAIYGSRFRSALEDSLYRMENGTNRSSGRTYGQAWTNWVNGSVGAIMFFNARSAVLQTLSTVNFINFDDNNIFKAGKAFANQKQYWSDFSTLFNSDFLKARRAGLQINVNEAELANAVAGAQNKAKAALAYLLKKGFLPTQMADSFAIASGGSTFYRNRVETYTKQGMDKKAAEEKAFLDFQEIAQETQQSARPDRISQQQASPLGRLILAFANTPMQYNRLIKKAARDLINNRGDWRSNVSRILYYGAIQNVIFSALQSAIFALSFDDEEDDALDQRATRIANSMLDTILRGSGVTGAAVATIKNTIMRFISESERKSRADYGQVVVEAVQVSPPMGAKARKVYSALNAYKFNREIMGSMDTFDYNNPIWDATAKVTTAATNVPLDRLFRKTDNIREALNQENTAMQRAFLTLGWSAWDLQVGERVVVNKGKENQYVRYLDLKRQAQQEAKDELKEKKKREKKQGKNQCSFIKRDSSRCKNMVDKPKTRCYAHD